MSLSGEKERGTDAAWVRVSSRLLGEGSISEDRLIHEKKAYREKDPGKESVPG